MKKKILTLCIIVIACFTANCQTPYNFSIGGVVGATNGVTFKMAPTKHFSAQLDLGYRLIDLAYNRYSLALNPNLMYEGYINQNWNWFVGGGLSIGFARYNYRIYNYTNDAYYYNYHTDFLLGINAIGGAEYTFSNIPLTLQADVRPGFVLFCNHHYEPLGKFDFSFLNFSARYSF